MILALVTEAVNAGARRGPACRAAGITARTAERWRARPEADDGRHGPHRRPHNALSPAEEAQVLSVMTSARFAHASPKQLVPQLADEGLYLASESTMYRLRHKVSGTSPRPPRCTPITRATAVHRATGPNQVWSWDITWLATVVRGVYVYLYLVMDVWSRRIVGWALEDRETADAAAELIRGICETSGVDPRGLVLHSDNGKPMRGSTMVSTLQWLGIVPSFSRPHVSDDNPYSEALFRTLKHTPAYPRLPFADAASAETWVERFVAWYNGEHRHSAIRYVTPDERHEGDERSVLGRRAALYEQARRANPERWSGRPRHWKPIGDVTLNPEPTSRDRPMKASSWSAQSGSRAAQPASSASAPLTCSSTPGCSDEGQSS